LSLGFKKQLIFFKKEYLREAVNANIKAMKTIQQLLAMLTLLLSTTIASAQIINCADFSILGFGPDAFSSGNSVIHIRLEGDSSDFISYPYVTLLIDCNGDTIATGNLSFFGQQGQTVQSYQVTGDISNACLPISVEFVYGNSNFENDTCTLTISALPPALNCNDFLGIAIETDQSNTLVNISVQGSANTYISNPQISIVRDCAGDSIANGFVNYSGQTGLSSQGYPITPLSNTPCYPVTVEFIYGNTNFETDTCLLTLNAPTALEELIEKERSVSIYPNPSSNEIYIHANNSYQGKNYLMYDCQGRLLITGKLVKENTLVDIRNFPNGFYFLSIGNEMSQIFKVMKE